MWDGKLGLKVGREKRVIPELRIPSSSAFPNH